MPPPVGRRVAEGRLEARGIERRIVRPLRHDAELGDESSHDFGRDIIPRMIGDDVPVYAHAFENEDGTQAYWRDVGTLDAYYEANMDLCAIEPKLNLYDETWPIYTNWHKDPPAKTVLDE